MRVVPQLLEKIREAQVVLDLTHSVGGGDFKSPDPDPGAESADVSKARAHVLHVRPLSSSMGVRPHALCLHVGYIGCVGHS